VTTDPGVAEPRPLVVGVMYPLRLDSGTATSFGAALALQGVRRPLDFRQIPWADTAEVRAAKGESSHGRRWIAARESPLDEGQLADLRDAEVLVALDLPLDIASLAPRLRWVQGVGAGVGQLTEVLRGTGIRLSTAAGIASGPIAEFVMARLLGVWKDLRHLDQAQRSRRWVPRPGTMVEGKTLGVVGTGAIGRDVAWRARPFGLRVLGVRRRPERGCPDGFDAVVGPDGLVKLLGDSDAVVLSAPATSETTGLIGLKELAAMRRGAILCNVARGSLVDEVALVDSLESGHLGAAVLDVTAHEPLSRRSSLWSAPRCYISPHVATSWGPPYTERLLARAAENAARLERGEALVSPADMDLGY
jgi:phosphoglycerate dehydrogenase-like enzyme